MPNTYLSPNEVEALFCEQIPFSFLTEIVDRTFAIYAETPREALRDYTDNTAHDFIPHIRHARMEDALLFVSKQHRQLKARHVPNRTRTNYHVEVRGGMFILTESMLPQRNRRLRPAQYRKALAVQYSLFHSPDIDQDTTDELIYGVLIHGGSPLSMHPSFIDIVFPYEDGRSSPSYRMDLIRRVRAAGSTDLDAVAPEPRIRRTDTKRQGGTSGA